MPGIIVIDENVRFDPFQDISGFGSDANRGNPVIGKVTYVNYHNRWFSVQYDCGGEKHTTSFNFSQIGRDVVRCG